MSDDNANPIPAGLASSQALKEAFFVAAAAAATIGALELILSSARSTASGFQAAQRHNDHSATTGLAQVAAGVSKILGDDGGSRRSQGMMLRESRTTSPADGAPVVT